MQLCYIVLDGVDITVGPVGIEILVFDKCYLGSLYILHYH